MLTEAAERKPGMQPDLAMAPAAPATPIFISLSSFGAGEVRRHGQLWFAKLAFEAGADGVEVRSELLVEPASELPALADAARQAGRQLVYSCAEPLWNADRSLDAQTPQRAIADAQTLGATLLKMSIGRFAPSSALPGDIIKLRQVVQTHAAATGGARAVELLIENDQTVSAGSLGALVRFFAAAARHDLRVGVTFDMGNWHWIGECPLQAAAALAPQVRYVHCKGVQRQPKRWVAVPLADSSAPWRSVLRALPATVPWAIEYPLAGDDLLSIAREEITLLRSVASTMVSARFASA